METIVSILVMQLSIVLAFTPERDLSNLVCFGGKCSSDKNCTIQTANASCIEMKCTCGEGSILIFEDGRHSCQSGRAYLNGECLNNFYCTWMNGKCLDHKCMCGRNFGSAVHPNINGEKICLEGIVDFGGRCTHNDYCTKKTKNAECIERRCRCGQGTTIHNGSCIGILGYRETCNETKQCDKKKGLVCKGGKCICDNNTGFHKNRCRYGYVSYGDKCSDNLACSKQTTNSSCIQKKCACGKGTILVYENRVYSCKSARVNLNETCQSDKNCAWISAKCLDSKCTCRRNFGPADHPKIKGKKTCLKGAVPFGGRCSRNEFCTKKTKHAKCVGTRCVCEKGMTFYNDSCIGTLGEGESCKYSKQCNATKHLDCNNNKCECKSNYGKFGFHCQIDHVRYNGRCSRNSACTKLTKQAACINNKCSCESPAIHVYDPKTRRHSCERERAYLKGECQNSTYCAWIHGVCEKKICECETNFGPSYEPDNYFTEICREGHIGYKGPCTKDAGCKEIKGVCRNGMCMCDLDAGYEPPHHGPTLLLDGYRYENPQNSLGSCKKDMVPYGERCSNDGACKNKTENSKCIGHRCLCGPDKIHYQDKCLDIDVCHLKGIDLCHVNATCENALPNGFHCICNHGFTGNGTTCSALPKDCQDVRNKGNSRSGVYEIALWNGSLFPVYCIMGTHGTGGTVIQRRGSDLDVDFYRNWNDYKDGFGNPEGDFWLGNDKLRYLTNTKLYELNIKMEDFENNSFWVKYSTFAVGTEENDFPLKVSRYSGSAGLVDSLQSHNGMKFCTKDHGDNRSAIIYRTGFWCADVFEANPNGDVHEQKPAIPYHGLFWTAKATGDIPGGTRIISIKSFLMVIRPLQPNGQTKLPVP